MKHTLPGQLDLPALPEAPIDVPKSTAPATEQKPCDIGLFSEDAKQIDLVDLVNKRKTE